MVFPWSDDSLSIVNGVFKKRSKLSYNDVERHSDFKKLMDYSVYRYINNASSKIFLLMKGNPTLITRYLITSYSRRTQKIREANW